MVWCLFQCFAPFTRLPCSRCTQFPALRCCSPQFTPCFYSPPCQLTHTPKTTVCPRISPQRHAHSPAHEVGCLGRHTRRAHLNPDRGAKTGSACGRVDSTIFAGEGGAAGASGCGLCVVSGRVWVLTLCAGNSRVGVVVGVPYVLNLSRKPFCVLPT